MDLRAIVRAAVAGGSLIVWITIASGCGTQSANDEVDANPGPNFSSDGGGVGSDSGTPENPPAPATFDVTLVPDGATGTQRVNFAIPFAAGVITDESNIKIIAGGFELPAARRALAKYADGSIRSVQL